MVRRGGREAGSVWLRAHVARERVKRSGGEGESEGRRKGEQEGSPLGGRGEGGALLVLSVCWVWRRVGAWVRGWVSLGGGSAVEGSAPLLSEPSCVIDTPSRIVIVSLSGGWMLSSSSYLAGWLKRSTGVLAGGGLLVPFFPFTASGIGSCAMPERVAY